MNEKQEVIMLRFELNVIASDQSKAQQIGQKWVDELKELFLADAWKLTVTPVLHGLLYIILIIAT